MLVAVCSVKGSPGVTTFSIALAARWPEPAWVALVEFDPSGGDIAVRFSLDPSPGLVSLAAASRRNAEPGLLWRHAQALPGGLEAVVAPPGAEQARAAIAALQPTGSAGATLLRRAADITDAVVVVDCGRVDNDPAQLALLRSADITLLLSGSRADDLAHVAARRSSIGRMSRNLALVPVGDGYPTTEIASELAVPVLARIPWDQRGAALLRGKPGRRHAPSRTKLAKSARRIAHTLASTVEPTREGSGANANGTLHARNGTAAGPKHELHDPDPAGQGPNPQAPRAEHAEEEWSIPVPADLSRRQGGGQQ